MKAPEFFLDGRKRWQICFTRHDSATLPMNPSSVRLFPEVADTGRLSKVALRRQNVRAHISRQIAEFEANCGGRLFHRTGRGVTLTELGERAARRLRAWLHDTEQLESEMRADAGQCWAQCGWASCPRRRTHS